MSTSLDNLVNWEWHMLLQNNMTDFTPEMMKKITLTYQYINYASEHPLWLNMRIKTRALEKVCFSLISRLQTSMEPEHLFAIFRQELFKYLPISSLTLSYKNSCCHKSGLEQRGYCISQRLAAEGKGIGHLKCHFEEKPTLAQVTVLKRLTKVFSYPLNNAIDYQHIKSMALTDNLTGLANRNQFEMAFQHHVSRSVKSKSNFSLLILDLDGFKSVNDDFGHQTGDLVLASFANILLSSCREGDRAFRFGGDEFTILLHDAKEDAVPQIAKRIKQTMSSCQFMTKFGLSCSIGSALYQKHDGLHQLFGRADEALLRAKEKGKDCLEMSPCNRLN